MPDVVVAAHILRKVRKGPRRAEGAWAGGGNGSGMGSDSVDRASRVAVARTALHEARPGGGFHFCGGLRLPLVCGGHGPPDRRGCWRSLASQTLNPSPWLDPCSG